MKMKQLEIVECKLSKENSFHSRTTTVTASIDVVDEDIVSVNIQIRKGYCDEYYFVEKIVVDGGGNDWGSPVRTMKAALFAVKWFQKTFEDEYKVIPD